MLNIKLCRTLYYTISNPVFQEFGNKKRRIHKKHSESERKQKTPAERQEFLWWTVRNSNP